MSDKKSGGMSFGDIHQSVTGTGAVGQIGENTAEVNVTTGDAGPSWEDVEAKVIEEFTSQQGTDALAMDSATEAADSLDAVRLAAESEVELTDDQVNTFTQGLAWMKINAPGALRIAAECIRRGPQGAAAKLLDIMAGYVEG